ncbi:hypothetical protein GCM10011344_22610 [Dokdonia pacifica]|uniref:Uncharacterized protein n=2 Tax=Dokdonia pacifica TaxID=1627892 RepID=A0A238WI10_9FLAO|nr:hypothetical protein GCM10011344_22610 [Dokdonia pacifica]SNR46097.1 hypothetical protein SAMN06265376_1011092 [Dokdonia pacifica]
MVSCSDPIQNNSRISFDFKVINESNQPISDIGVSASALRSGVSIFIPIIPSFEGVLGVGTTDNQGEANLISLSPDETISRIGVLINSEEQSAETPLNEDYGVVIYQLDSIITRNTVLPDVVLKRSATLEIEIIDTPTLEGTLSYAITYPARVQKFQIPSGEEAISETIEGSGILESSEILVLETLQNTTALFTYFITSNGVTESDTIEIPINQETVQYAFEF